MVYDSFCINNHYTSIFFFQNNYDNTQVWCSCILITCQIWEINREVPMFKQDTFKDLKKMNNGNRRILLYSHWDIKGCHGNSSTLVQIMDCHMMAPSHHVTFTWGQFCRRGSRYKEKSYSLNENISMPLCPIFVYLLHLLIIIVFFIMTQNQLVQFEQ